MSFIIRGNIGGSNALDTLNEETDPVRQSAVRLSLGLKVSHLKRERSDLPFETDSYARPSAITKSDHLGNSSLRVAAANKEAAATEVVEIEAAARAPKLAGFQTAQPVEFPQTGSPHNRSAYDLDSFTY